MSGRGRERRQILVGIATLALIALIAVYAAGAGGFANDRGGYILSAEFRQVDGLRVGSPVLLAGTEVGRVSRLTLSARLRPRIEMTIRADVRIPADSAALVLSDGLLGGKYLKIEPGAEDRYMAEGDSFDFVQNAVIVEQILARIVRDAERRRDENEGREGGAP